MSYVWDRQDDRAELKAFWGTGHGRWERGCSWSGWEGFKPTSVTALLLCELLGGTSKDLKGSLSAFSIHSNTSLSIVWFIAVFSNYGPIPVSAKRYEDPWHLNSINKMEENLTQIIYQEDKSKWYILELNVTWMSFWFFFNLLRRVWSILNIPVTEIQLFYSQFFQCSLTSIESPSSDCPWRNGLLEPETSWPQLNKGSQGSFIFLKK